jgi:hypothetical protein
LWSNVKAIADILQSYFAAFVEQFCSDCGYIAEPFRSICAAIMKRVQNDYLTFSSWSREKRYKAYVKSQLDLSVFTKSLEGGKQCEFVSLVAEGKSEEAIAAQSERNRSAIAALSQRNCSSIAAQSQRNRSAIAAQSQRNRSAIAAQSQRNRSAIVAQS